MTIQRLLWSLCLLSLLAGCMTTGVSSPPSPATPSLSIAAPIITSSALPLTTADGSPTPTPVPIVAVQSGDDALFNGDYQRAESQYAAAYASSTDSGIRAAALWGLGRVYHQAGNNAQAIDDLWALIASYPDAPNTVDAYFLLGDIFMSLQRYTEAAQAYTVYAALRPGVIDFYVHSRRGDALLAAKDYPDAISAYQTALAAPHAADDTQVQFSLAEAFADNGNIKNALTVYESLKASSSDDSTKARVDLEEGDLYLAHGQASQAYQVFQDAVTNYPTSYDSYSALVALVNDGVSVDDLERGLVDYFAGQYGFALDAFERYISANPNNDGTAAYYQALTNLAMGNYQKAVDGLTAFITSYPDNHHWQDAWETKADTQWEDLGDYNSAAQTWLALAAASSDPSVITNALLDAGSIYERDNRLEDAATTWENIANQYPGSDLVSQALFDAGIVRYRLGEYSPALTTFQRDELLSTASSDQARAFFWIGKTEQQLGQAESAQATFQQAAAADPYGYYSLRAQDTLIGRAPFATPPPYNLNVDLTSERQAAEAWLRVTFKLPSTTDLSGPGSLAQDPRFVRGSELWALGQQQEAVDEFESLSQAENDDAANCFRLGNALLSLGLYNPAIFALRQVLTLAGMDTQAETLAAPIYFNHVRYGLYYPDLVLPASLSSGLDPLFLYSVVREESLFESFIQSTAGAVGLMQIIPTTGEYLAKNLGWPNFSVDDLDRPLINIELGTDYLLTNRNAFNGNLYATLAAYNAGPTSASIWLALSGPDPDLFLEVVRYSATSSYIQDIFVNYAMYEQFYGTSR